MVPRQRPGPSLNQTPPSDPPAVVLVEDDASLLRALTFALEAEGLTVRSYRAAGEALLAAPAPADLTTTNPDERTRRAAALAGVSIVEKPLLTGELRSRIGELIDGDRRRSLR